MPDSSRRLNIVNASGRRVSILNDDYGEDNSSGSYYSHSPSWSSTSGMPLTLRQLSGRTASSTPTNSSSSSNYGYGSDQPPELFRSSSYDSQASGFAGDVAISPMTPSGSYWDGASGVPGSTVSAARSMYSMRAYDEYDAKYDYPGGGGEARQSHRMPAPAPVSPGDTTGTGHDDDDTDSYSGSASNGGGASGGANGANGGVRPKRYPCRFADELGCDKTFTTSGHASRHSKIHTSEKSIQCPYDGCHKKFTRSDNMKQHYETHVKEKPGKHHHSSHHSHPSKSSRHHSHSSSSGLDALAAVCAADH